MSVSDDMLGTPEIFFLGHLFSHCELLRRIEDSLRVDILAGLNRPKEFSLAERLLTGRCPVDPDKLDRPGDDPRPLDGINRTNSHVIIAAKGTAWAEDMMSLIQKQQIPGLTKWYNEGGKEELENIAGLVPNADVVYGPLYRNPKRIFGIGLNYVDHAGDIGSAAPSTSI